MLLTFKPPSQNGIKGPHEYSIVHQSVPIPRSPSPSVPGIHAPTVPSTSPADYSMDSSRSGYPPPSSLTLPPPDVGFTMAAMNQQLPPPPAQWQNSDDSMHHWLQAKAEEDRRRQEEEKTRQETLRLEQRRVEQSMLRDSLQAGVPPHMVPLIFAGISQSSLPQPILELAQQYLAQSPGGRAPAPQLPSLSQSHSHGHSHSHSQHRTQHSRRESRSIPPGPYAHSPSQHAVPGPSVLLSQPLQSNPAAPPTPQSLGRQSISGGATDSRAGATPRINHSVASQAQSVPINLSNVHYAPGSSVPAPQASGKPGSHSRHSPPSLYFHHWVPPGQPPSNTPPTRIHQESPVTQTTPRRLEDQTSPGRKRKAPGPHHPAPLPSSRLSETLQGLSQTSRPGTPVARGQRAESVTHRHQPSDASISYEYRASDPVELDHASDKASPIQFVPRVAPPAHTSGLEKSRQPMDDPEHSGNLSPEGNTQYPHKVLQTPYESSAETAPRDSDLDSSPRRSPASRAPLASI